MRLFLRFHNSSFRNVTSIYHNPRKSKDQTLPIGRIRNPCSMDHPKAHSLFFLVLDFQGLNQRKKLVGGWTNPFEKYADRQIGWKSSPSFGVKIPKIFELPPPSYGKCIGKYTTFPKGWFGITPLPGCRIKKPLIYIPGDSRCDSQWIPDPQRSLWSPFEAGHHSKLDTWK